MKPTFPTVLRRTALWLPALSLMVAPLAAHAKYRADAEAQPQESQRFEEQGVGGRAGIVEEFNLGPAGMDVIKQRENRTDAGGNRLLSGRVVELKGQTLYVERDGVVVPLDLSELRINKQPKPGQQIIATYQVDRTHNVARS